MKTRKRNDENQMTLGLATEDSLFFRSFELDVRALDEEARTVDLSFSSEAPVMRWFWDDEEGRSWYGAEVLLHAEKNVELARLRSVGSLLYGHRPEEMKNILGPIKKVWIDAEKRVGRSIVGFDADESGNMALGKVKNKSLRGVSFAYRIKKARILREKEEWTDPDTSQKYKGPALLGTRWMPYEITLTPVPADSSIGVGRNAARSLEGIEIQNSTSKKEKDEMKPEEVQAMIDTSLATLRELIPNAEDIAGQVRDALQADDKPKFRVSADEYSEILGRATAISEQAVKHCTEMLLEGKTADEMRAEILKMVEKPDGTQTTKTGENTGIPPGKTANTETIPTKMDEVEDDELTRMLTSGSALPNFGPAPQASS